MVNSRITGSNPGLEQWPVYCNAVQLRERLHLSNSLTFTTLHGSKISCQCVFLLSALFNRIYYEITIETVWNSKGCSPGHAGDPARSLINFSVSHVGCVVNWSIDDIIQVYFLEVHHLSFHYLTAGNAAIAAVPCYCESVSTRFVRYFTFIIIFCTSIFKEGAGNDFLGSHQHRLSNNTLFIARRSSCCWNLKHYILNDFFFRWSSVRRSLLCALFLKIPYK